MTSTLSPTKLSLKLSFNRSKQDFWNPNLGSMRQTYLLHLTHNLFQNLISIKNGKYTRKWNKSFSHPRNGMFYLELNFVRDHSETVLLVYTCIVFSTFQLVAPTALFIYAATQPGVSVLQQPVFPMCTWSHLAKCRPFESYIVMHGVHFSSLLHFVPTADLISCLNIS